MKTHVCQVLRACMILCALWLAAPTDAAAPSQLSRSVIEWLYEQGYEMPDILAAETLMQLYDVELMDTLQARRSGVPWLEIVGQLETRRPVYTALTARDIDTLLRKGYGAESIVFADLMAHRFGTPVEEMLIVKPSDWKWRELFDQLYRDEALRATPPAIGQVDQKQLDAGLLPNVSRESVARMVARGFGVHDMRRASQLSQKYQVDVELVVATKAPHIDWGVAEALLKRLVNEK